MKKRLPHYGKRSIRQRDKVLAYDEQLVRNFIEEIRVFPDKLTITVKGGAKEGIAI